MRVPWVSVALLVVLGMFGALTYSAWDIVGQDDGGDLRSFERSYLWIGWLGVGGSLLVGALGLWARAPATLATALGIVGAGAFAGAWIAHFARESTFQLETMMLMAFLSILIAFAASARRPA